jgi:virulence-associated protein VapD
MMMMMFEMVTEQEQEKKVPDGTKSYSSIKELENRFDNSQEKQCSKYANEQRMKSYGY